jgi:BON domain
MSSSEQKPRPTAAAPRPERAPAGRYGEGGLSRYGVHGDGSFPGRPPSDASQASAMQPATAGADPASVAMEHDDQLRELIRQRLTEDPLLDATDVRVKVHNGRVTLAGTATSTRSKAEIEQTVENCGVLEVDNQLRALR